MNKLLQVLAVSLVLTVVHGDLVVDRCTSGSSYWCKNFNTAKECGKINECKKTIWIKPMQNDEICVLCKDAVEAIASYINKNGTKQMVKSAFLKLCNEVPLPDLSKECTQAVSQDFDMLYDEIVLLIENGDLVCGALGLCSSSVEENHAVHTLVKSLPQLLKNALNSNRLPIATVQLMDDVTTIKDEDCSDCQNFLNGIHKKLQNNAVVDELKKVVKVECNSLGPGLDDICREEVEEIISGLLKYAMSDKDTGKLCHDMKMCHFRSHKAEGSDICTDCKNFVGDLQSVILKNNTLLNQLVDEMAGVYCLQKPKFLRKQCSRYVAMAIRISLNRMMLKSPGEVCTAVGFCNAPQLLEDIRFSVMMHQKSMESTEQYCTDCTTFLTDLQGVARNNKSIVDDLTSLIEQQCDRLGSILSGLCRGQIPTAIGNLLPQFETANVGQLCTTILMCQAPPTVPAVGGKLCHDCIAFANDWKAILAANETNIDQLLDQAAATYCNQLPFFVQKCDDVARQGIQNLLNDVEHNDANSICAAVYLCPAPSKNRLTHDSPKLISIAEEKETAVAFTKMEKVQDPISCALCRIVVHEIDKMIQGNRTEAVIVKALDKVCSLVPSEFAKECRNFIDTYGKDVVDMLINEVESGVICSQLFLCSARPKPKLKVDNVPLPCFKELVYKESALCEVCELVAGELEKILTDKSTEKEIITAVEKVCTVVPSSYKAECDDFIEQYGDDVIQLLASLVSPSELCTLLRLCPKKFTFNPTTTCDLCVVIAEELDNLLESNRTEEDIIKAVDKVCSVLPSYLEGECKALIEDYGKKIIDALVNKVKPEVLCSTIGLCSSKLRVEEGSALCEVCELVAGELDKILTDKSTEKEIIAAVEKVCTVVPPSYKAKCDDFIEQYGDDVIQLLASLISPSELCTLLKLCPKKFTSITSSALCTVCTLVAGEIDSLLEENKTEAEIEKIVDKVCGLLPQQYKDDCDAFVNEYSDEIIKLLVNLVPPKTICSALKLCAVQLQKKQTSMESCLLCEAVATELDNKLKDKPTQQEIEDALDKVCLLVTGKLRDECLDFIKVNGPAILDLLASEVDPSVLCPELHMCPKKVVKVKGTLCDVCKLAINFLDQELAANATRAEIEKELNTICAKLPAELKGECDDLVAQYTPQILDLAEHIFDPTYVCLHLDLCDKIRKPVLVGRNRCTYGPSYWCKNEDTARECNAAAHCRLHVWN